ncbi:MAG: ATP-binding cassette domain-containing protein, partial [Bacteroidales bacterium]
KMQVCSEIGMLFQGSALFDSLTIMENVLFPMKMFSDKTDKEQQNRARFCLERVGLNNTGDLFPSELSGGMQKRAAIARAISLNPKYLFCDEPNSGLDPLSAIKIDELIVELTKEFQMTTIINTHDLNSVLSVGEQIVFIHKGVKAWEGPKEKIFVSGCPELNEFIFASEMFQKFRNNLITEQSGLL